MWYRLAKMRSSWPHPFRMRLSHISFCAFCCSCCLGHVTLSSGLGHVTLSSSDSSSLFFAIHVAVSTVSFMFLGKPVFIYLWDLRVFICLWDLTLQCLILLLLFACFSLQFQTNIFGSYFPWITWFLIGPLKKEKRKLPIMSS